MTVTLVTPPQSGMAARNAVPSTHAVFLLMLFWLLLALALPLQNSDCDNPGTPQSGTGGCFFEQTAWDRINAQELEDGTPQGLLTPSVTLEEAEFTLNSKNLSAFIEDGKLMATTLLPGGCRSTCKQLARHTCSTSFTSCGACKARHCNIGPQSSQCESHTVQQMRQHNAFMQALCIMAAVSTACTWRAYAWQLSACLAV